jgi:hypothetical protein
MLLKALSLFKTINDKDTEQLNIAFCLACSLGKSEVITMIMQVCEISPENSEYLGQSAMHMAAVSNND